MNRRKPVNNGEDGTFWEYIYNARGEVTSSILKHGTSALPGWSYNYVYDSFGNRTSVGGTSETNAYTLNTRNQVTSVSNGSLYMVKGRAPTPSTPVITVDGIAQTVTNGTYGSHDYFKSGVSNFGPKYDQVTVTSGGDSGTWYTAVPPATDNRTYDYSGNLKTDWRWTYTWDAYDRLLKMVTQPTAVSAGVPNLTLDFVYDHMGRRMRKTVKIGTTIVSDTKFVCNGWNLVAELNALSADAMVRRYLWGADLSGTIQGAGGVGGLLAIGQVAGTATDQMVCMDGNGNIMALVDAALSTSAAIKARYTYDAFGQKNRAYGVFAATNPFGFSSKYEDSETGLLYYGYRFYDPAGGRWLSRDPIGEEGGLNLYGFVGNNAVSRWDYLGLKDFLIGFYGAGSHDNYGNAWLKKIYDDAGGDGYLFSDGEDGKAIEKLFAEIDTNGDKTIVSSEISQHTYKAVGYSWGGPTTTHLTLRLFKKENQGKKQIEGYELCATVPFKMIVTIDPVTIIKGMDAPESNVERWVNYYQQRKTSLMDLFQGDKPAGTVEFGSIASKRFHGKSWPEAARNINVPVDWSETIKRQEFLPDSPLIGTMPGLQVNHDTINWFVYEDAITELK